MTTLLPSQTTWKRYWGERDGSHHIDQFGFLDHSEYYKDSFEFTQLREQPCLLLLGEPGIGKSFAIKDAAAQQISKNDPEEQVFFFDLRSYGSEDRLFRALFEGETIQNWLEGDYRLHLFLDSLDECLLRVDTVAALLVDELGKAGFPRERLMLRIACRTADLPPLLENELFRLWQREGKKGIYELCPLQRGDVIQSSIENGIDAEAFLTEVIDKNIGTLAARPITLRMLLNLFRREGQFPSRPSELYELGCRALCDESNENRRSSIRVQGASSPEETLLVASRIAAFTVLCNRAAIWTGRELGEHQPEDILVRELVGGQEKLRATEVPVTEEAIRSALRTGLFTSRGANRQGWAHQTFAEFLAAWYINQKDMPLETILSLVTNTTDRDKKPPPQLGETLSWLASMRGDVREHLLRTEPLLLLKSDSATFTDDFKAVLVDELLGMFVREETFDDIDLHSYYSRLNHPTLAEQLRPYIADKQLSITVRRVAADIAQECSLRDLENDLAQVVLDEDDNHHVRVNAGYALWKVGDSETRLKLRDFALNGSPDDKDLELKGVALLATWPDCISASVLFGTIEDPPDGFYGAYSLFLSRFVGFLRISDIPIAFEWIVDKFAEVVSDFSLRRVTNQIFSIAERHLDQPEVLASFCKALARMLSSYSFSEVLNARSLAEAGNDKFLKEDALRRKVLVGLSNHDDVNGQIADSVLHVSFLRPKVEDLSWLFEELSTASSEKAAWFFARLIGAFYGIHAYHRTDFNFHNVAATDPAAFSLLFDATAKSPIVRVFFGSLFEPMELESESATRQREWFEDAKKQQKEWEEMRKAPPLLDPPPSQRVQELLAKIESGDLSSFWALSQTLTLEPDSQYMGHWSDADMADFVGWKKADAATQLRIVDSAKKYVVAGEPENDKWVGTLSYQNVALAGYHALFLLLKVTPEYIDLLSPNIWKKWTAIITLFPLYSPPEEQMALHQQLVERAYRHAPADVLTSITTQLDFQNIQPKAHPALSSSKFDRCWDERFAANLRDYVENRSLDVALRTTILRELLMHNDAQTEELALRPLKRALAGEEIDSKDVLSAASLLSQHASSDVWGQTLFEIARSNAPMGRSIIETISHFGSPANSLTEEDTADFFIWLEEQYPHNEDPPMLRGSFVGVDHRQELGRWRDSFLYSLVNRGTLKAVDELERIRSRFPELDWLKRMVIDAKAVARRNTWEPVKPTRLFEIIGQTQATAVAVIARPINDDEIDELNFLGAKVSSSENLTHLLRSFRDRPSSFVFFTGAGLSAPLFPSWTAALETLLDRRYTSKGDDARRDDLQQMFVKGNYLDVADMCARDLGQEEYRTFVKETFDKNFAANEIPAAYRELFQIRPRTILTTNYDRIPDVGAEGYQIFHQGESAEANIAVQQQQACVFKLHGSVASLESIVFTATEYQDTYQDETFKGLLQAILRLTNVVFLGFSFADPYFTQLLEGVFVASKRLLQGKYALIEGLSKTEAESMENRFGLKILPYSKSDMSHPEVVEFLRLLGSVQ